MSEPASRPENDAQSLDRLIEDTLLSIRRQLGMEVAFLAEIHQGERIFRYVDAADPDCPVRVGGSHPLEQTYCQRIVDGRLPALLPDATRNAEAMSLPVTQALPVGAHLGVPVTLPDGRLYGTFCCFSRTPNACLDERDLATLRLVADFLGKLIGRLAAVEDERRLLVRRLREVIDRQAFRLVYQPIVFVARNQVVGYEALTRFQHEPVRTPDKWFNEAAEVGLQEELELAVIRRALLDLERFPADTYLSLNISPETLLTGSLERVLDGYPLERLMIEVTEHVSVRDYALIAERIAPLRACGLRLAVDDAGAGYASFRHILKLKPDVIKLDSSLIRRIDRELESRALAAALIRFAEETGCKIVAEGVETQAELEMLQSLKVNKAQGYLLGRPAPLEELGFTADGAPAP